MVTVSGAQAASPAGRIDLNATLSHSGFDFTNGRATIHLSTPGMDLRRVQNVQQRKPGLSGALRVTADATADLRREQGSPRVLLTRVDANGGVTGIQWNGKPLGNATFQGETKGPALSLKLDSDFAKSAIHGVGQVDLRGEYQTDANLTFTNVTYSELQGFLGTQATTRPDFDALVEGQAHVTGPAMRPQDLKGALRLSRAELLTTRHSGTAAAGTKTVILLNQGAIVAHLDHSSLRIDNAFLAGKSTNFSVKGTVALDNRESMNLTVNGDVNLDILNDMYRDLFSSGAVALNANVRGSMTQPAVNGTIQLSNSSLSC